MIRREIRLADREPCWLLISQVEHARISGVLAAPAIEFAQSLHGVDLSEVREELLSAITHHDDGWAAWEAEPGLDEQGCPLSFRELPLAESIPIWTASIEAAAAYGKLAEYAVTLHFLALFESSEKSRTDPNAMSWQTKMNDKKRRMLAEWRENDSEGVRTAIARAALGMLQSFDLASLWLCSACPGGGEHVDQWPKPYRFGDQSPEFSCLLPDNDAEYPANLDRCRATIQPWPFVEDELAIEAKGQIVPVRKYRDSAELKSAMHPHEVRWLLMQPS